MYTVIPDKAVKIPGFPSERFFKNFLDLHLNFLPLYADYIVVTATEGPKEDRMTEKKDNVTEKKDKKRQLIFLIIIIVVILAAAAVVILTRPKSESLLDNGVPKLGYAEGTTVVRGSDALQKAVDDMVEKLSKGNVMLEYDADAYSSDGENFTCYLANATENSYDMYFDMYADSAFTDEIFLSGLVPPGKALNQFKATRKLDKGDHEVYMAFTTVEDDHTTARSQILVTMNLHVK